MENEDQQLDPGASLSEGAKAFFDAQDAAAAPKEDADEGKPGPDEPKSDPDEDGGETPGGQNGTQPKELDEQTLKDIREGKIFPKHRFDEVSQQLQRYKALGSPEELAKTLAAINAKEAGKNGKPGAATETDKQVRDYILNVAPELKKVLDYLPEIEQGREERNLATQSVIDATTKEIGEFATKEMGIDAKDQAQINMVHNLAAQIIKNDPELERRFYRLHDRTVIAEVKTQLNKFLSGIRRAEKAAIVGDKKITAKLPKPVGAGGIPPGGTPPKPDNGKVDLREVGERAWEAMQSGRVGE